MTKPKKSRAISSTRAVISEIEDRKKEDPIGAFDVFYSAFKDVRADLGDTNDYYYRVAGKVISLRFAGNSLVPYLTRALAHLATEPIRNPDLEINLWDTESAKSPLPFLLENLLQLDPAVELVNQIGLRGEVPQFSDERFLCSLQLGPNILTILDKARSKCVYWIRSVDDLPYEKMGSPLRSVMNWWFSSLTRQFIHAGAVGTEQGGVLLAGEAGAGKSTTALNCLLGGLFYAGDDYVLVDLDPNPMAYTVFQTAKVKTFQDIARFREAKSWAVNSEGSESSKPLMFIGEHKPEQVIESLPLNAIVFPRFVPGESVCLSNISEHDAFRQMVPSNIKQMAFADSECLKMIAELVRRLPSFSLTFGEDQENLATAVKQIIDENA